MQTLEVLFTPADFEALRRRDLSDSVCVVFDVLRATTTMLTALANGARSVIPVADIPAAVAWRRRRPEVLLAGERDGLRIRAERAGGVDFDLGNSPREFTAARVAGRVIVATTTNGTRALKACAGAAAILPAGLVNVSTVARWLARERPAGVVVVGSGTYEDAAYEDVLGAGALVDRLWPALEGTRVLDSARLARTVYRAAGGRLLEAVAAESRNGRRLLALPELAEDVALCLAEDTLPVRAWMEGEEIVAAGGD